MDEITQPWQGQLVPRSFNSGFVVLSYVVSLLGAASTLELINRRTAPKGLSNHLLLVGAAVTMGGISIWCMHFIGNRAIVLGVGDLELQIAYSSGVTAASFFVPIAVLFAAFVAIGTDTRILWWRVAASGTMAGAAICGMHYIGNASIRNYTCHYETVNVVGSAVIAVAASITALAFFFVFRAAWTSSLWKRLLTSVLLAGAVSGMHWCASLGTSYRFVSLGKEVDQLSQNSTVIVVICLFISACLVMMGAMIYTARTMRRYANKAQQVVLAAAIFDTHGRVLVSPDGLLPSERITESLIEKTAGETFCIAHPLFQWMFQVSRNWSSIATLLDGMSNHLALLPRMGKDSSDTGVRLLSDHGEPIEDYELVIRELFCVAAQTLAAKLKKPLAQMGMLWDDVLPTGIGGQITRPWQDGEINALNPEQWSAEDIAERGLPPSRVQDYGRGSLMFLVRQVGSSREVEALEAAGYRFAELSQVSAIIRSSMQIQTQHVEAKLDDMRRYAEDQGSQPEPGVGLSLFGVRARVGASGFEVLVHNSARGVLPSVRLPLATLKPWQLSFLRQFNRMSLASIRRYLEKLPMLSEQEESFAMQLVDALRVLRTDVGHRIFDEAVLSSQIVQPPCRTSPGSAEPNTAIMIAMHVVIPIHMRPSNDKCVFVPLSFFKIRQLMYPNSPHHLAFSRNVHREMASVLNGAASQASLSALHSKVKSDTVESSFTRLWQNVWGRFDRISKSRAASTVSRSTPPRLTAETGSTEELWTCPSTESAMNKVRSAQTSFGGIMVSQEITMQVSSPAPKKANQDGPNRDNNGADKSADPSSEDDIRIGVTFNAEVESPSWTFVDDLFAMCIEKR